MDIWRSTTENKKNVGATHMCKLCFSNMDVLVPSLLMYAYVHYVTN